MKRLVLQHDYKQVNNFPAQIFKLWEESGMFDISYEKFAFPNLLRLKRRICLFKYDNLFCCLDSDDKGRGINYLLTNNQFDFLNKIDVFLIGQGTHFSYVKKMRELGYVVYPWSYHPQEDIKVFETMYKEKYEPLRKHEYKACFVGAQKHGRKDWFELTKGDSEFKFVDCIGGQGNDLDRGQYVKMMLNSKVGLSLKGKGIKCTREYLLTYFGMPLVFNYKPEYPFEMVKEGIDYIYVKTPQDLKNLKLSDDDLKKYSERSKFLYENLYSSKGQAVLLERLAEDFKNKML